MIAFNSYGEKKPTTNEEMRSGVKTALVFVLTLVVVGAITWAGTQIKVWFPKEESCKPIVDGSVFTTGDMRVDARIAKAIEVDESEGKATSTQIAHTIYATNSFKFPDREAVDLWEKTGEVVKEQASNHPFLLINHDEKIYPYSLGDGIPWVWTDLPATKIESGEPSIFLTVSTVGKNNTPPVPTVLSSINGGTFIPAPHLDKGTVTAIQPEHVCPKEDTK